MGQDVDKPVQSTTVSSNGMCIDKYKNLRFYFRMALTIFVLADKNINISPYQC